MDDGGREWWEDEEWDWIEDTYYDAVAAHLLDRYNRLVERWNLIDCE